MQHHLSQEHLHAEQDHAQLAIKHGKEIEQIGNSLQMQDDSEPNGELISALGKAAKSLPLLI